MIQNTFTRRDFLVKSALGTVALLTAPYFTMNVRAAGTDKPIRIAVEFNSHAVPAYVAIEKGFYKEKGLNYTSYASYVTGVSLAAGLTRGDVDVAYICLIPAINAYANAGVPIKVLCATHLYGYGLAANPEKIQSIEDLEKPGIRVGTLSEGSAVDTLMHCVMEQHSLNKQIILSKIRRMNPPNFIFALRTGQLDAVFLPEHWLTMTERDGFSVKLTARDVWPNMIGSVLVAREELIQANPDIANKLVKATKKATVWMNQNPAESARIAARYLSFEGRNKPLAEVLKKKSELTVSSASIVRSMKNLEYVNSIDTGQFQHIIDTAARLGNIKKPFSADMMLDLQFLRSI
jgi:NitT/TauT family transport system substrate-binding protein